MLIIYPLFSSHTHIDYVETPPTGDRHAGVLLGLAVGSPLIVLDSLPERYEG